MGEKEQGSATARETGSGMASGIAIEEEGVQRTGQPLGSAAYARGAGPDTDGQILVLDDLLGFSDALPPRFVKAYAALWPLARAAAARYTFMEHCVTLARGFNYCTGFEIALKLKELTYVAAAVSYTHLTLPTITSA